MVEVKHKFISAKADGPDSTRLRPSNWNDDHDVTVSQENVVLGRLTAGAGPIEEVLMSQLLPAGVVLPFAGIAVPSGWAFPYGQTASRAGNPRLFAALGTTYGPGDGVSTFNLPDLRGAVPAGKVNMGGADRGNLSGAGTLGAYLGGQSNAAGVSVSISGSFSGGTAGSLAVNVSGTTDSASILSSAPSGGNTVTPNHTHSFTGNGATSGSLSCSGGISGSGGGSTAAFSIVQGTIALNYIINLG